jgi:hypothetical protein|tara:strand:+ start:2021 stop:2620 length:600 start_codon:yes stop_codon:yes gene_type:complete
MFNINLITCDYPLPISEERIEEMESPPDWGEMEFQFDEGHRISENILSKYSIESDGQIYEECIDLMVDGETTEPTVKQIDLGIEKKEYTGELVFHGIHVEEKHDFLMSFKALFWKGELKEIEPIEWKKEDNHKRKAAQDKMLKKIKKVSAKTNRWWYKSFLLFSNVVRCFLVLVAKFLGFLLRCISRLESRLSSHDNSG